MPCPDFLLQHLPLSLRHTPSSSCSTTAPSPPESSSTEPIRPHITLTWAQSLDSKLAGPGGARVILSGKESMEMTHWMRAMHDAILVGINTIILDDPRLQINLLPADQGLIPPQPIILDPSLRFPLSARLLSEWNKNDHSSGRAKQPWIVCGDNVAEEKKKQVEEAGARVVPVKLDQRGRIPPSSLPDILSFLSLGSVMMEGGSRILSSFLHAPVRTDGSPLVDSVVVTVAPMFIGEGVGVVPEGEDVGLPVLKNVHTEKMGKDAVMVCTMRQT